LAKISALKIESFQNFVTIFKILAKIKIGEHSICNFLTNFWGGGREIAQEGGEILPKVSPKLKAYFGKIL